MPIQGVKQCLRKMKPIIKQSCGFTLLEIMIVVLMIGILAIIALPAFKKVREASQNGRIINDFRIFATAFEQYTLENGDFPPDAGAGAIPTGMDGYLPSVWTAETPVGGNWDWDYSPAGISLVDSNLEDDQLTQIDEKVDDGDLNNGQYQKSGSSYTLSLE